MQRIIVAGIGTEVGKTVVSAILTTLLDGEYWKPIQCGDEGIAPLIKQRIHPPAYSLKAAVSPHHAARLENISICPELIQLPETTRPLIIESVGGIFVPLSKKILTIDLFEKWKARWVVVSRHYLGSINHTLLTLEALKQRKLSIAGLIFNGEPNPDSEAAILELSGIPFLGRVLPEANLNLQTIERYAKQWRFP